MENGKEGPDPCMEVVTPLGCEAGEGAGGRTEPTVGSKTKARLPYLIQGTLKGL